MNSLPQNVVDRYNTTIYDNVRFGCSNLEEKMHIANEHYVPALAGDTAREIMISPGVYEVVEIRNPFGFGAAWFVIKGSLVGMTKEGWEKERVVIREGGPYEFVIQ
jgi:hypothetical protein